MDTKLLREKPALFDSYVAAHPRGDVLQTTAWGRVKETTGWQFHPLALMDGGVLRASALILTKRLPCIPALLAYSPRGPLYSSPEALVDLLRVGAAYLKAQGALVWKMDPAVPEADSSWLDAARSLRLRQVETGLDFESVQPRHVMVLDISRSLDAVLDNMKHKTRYNIRYAQRKGVVVQQVNEKSRLGVFYTLLQETAKRDRFTARSYEYFEAIWDHLVERGLAKVFLAYHEGIPLAGAICFRLGSRAWYVYGASSSEKRNLQASHLLQWEMIRWAKGTGCTIYDFRGVSGDLRPENPLYGLYRFKEGFGAKLETYAGEFDLPIWRGGYALWLGGLAVHNWIRRSKKANR
ncbi:MAG TPA: peptidoglycan bridge formation glycyltransferase FemA/FemB family protein [Firmicutes bacterium]|nr:peptidoglycan bridge formation glycyltransferase FemA/FemB family protein [Bacillota bacterium]